MSLLAGSLILILACAPPALAYVGPGAGFAILSSFWTLLLAFLYSLFALVSWPVRRLVRLFRHRKAYGRAKAKRVVIVGLDGMDPDLAERYMNEGKLPHFAALRSSGSFRRLETTFPPISPVAWSSFQTGVNPGKHNIFDFLARDHGSYLPYLSSVQIRDAKRRLKIGKYTIPLGRPQIKLLRKAKPFWQLLGEAGIFCSVIRVPITFPPEKFAGVLLSGMCVPDLRGSQGTFTLYTTRRTDGDATQGGVRVPLEPCGENTFQADVLGPEDPLKAKGRGELRVPFTVRRDADRGQARIEIGTQRLVLTPGQYSDWVEVKFKAGLGIRVHGICRLYLKQLAPELELYVTPVNIHPKKPALPISHPLTYSIYLAKLLGPYATLGLAEDTWALNERVLDEASFLEQCYLIHQEREQMFFDALEKTLRGVCVCVFDITDRVQHMFWRYIVPDHPANPGGADSERYAGVIEELYRRMDDLVGRVLRRIDDNTILLVLSDHGFKSFARGVNLNTWLFQNGYLALKPGAHESGEWFHDVDWERTRAYAMGLNGLYINQKGRERAGIVAPGRETEELKQELMSKLRALADPQTGRVAIREIFDTQTVLRGPYRENAPNLLVGYNEGYRADWDCVTGEVTRAVFVDNCRAWSGDHCIDPRLVPGVLFSNRKIHSAEPAITDVAPTLYDLFGIAPQANLDGKAWTVSH